MYLREGNAQRKAKRYDVSEKRNDPFQNDAIFNGTMWYSRITNCLYLVAIMFVRQIVKDMVKATKKVRHFLRSQPGSNVRKANYI